MRRREFISLIGGAAASWPFVAHAQQGVMRRIGILAGFSSDDPEIQKRFAAFRQGLKALGWSEGHNLQIESRFADGDPDRFQSLAKELLALRPEVVFTTSGPVAFALKRQSDATAIVFAGASDPIGMGLVESLARPGGNLTGFLLYEEGITGKWLGMLKEIVPRLKRAALLGNPATVPYDYYLRAAENFARRLDLALVPIRIADVAGIEDAIADFSREPDSGLVLPADTTTNVHRPLLIRLASQYRLPAVYGNRDFVLKGGLMAYDTDRAEMYRRAASYVDQILRGAKPADLPVQVPTKYETLLNLKTAKQLDLKVPESLLVRADEVIE